MIFSHFKINMSQLALLALFSIMQITLTADENKIQQKFGYAEIANEYIPSLGLSAPQTPGANNQDKVDFSKTTALSDFEQYTTVFNVLEKSLTNQAPISLSPVSTLMQDLNILNYKSKNAAQRSHSLLAHISKDHVITLWGEACFAYLLAHPLANIQELRARQSAIRGVLHVHASEFETILTQYKQQELEFLACFKDPSQIEQEHINRLFFQKSFLERFNTNEYVLGTTARLGDAMVAFPFSFFSLIKALSNYAVQCSVSKQFQDNKDMVERTLGFSPIPFIQHLKKAVITEAQSYDPRTYKKAYNEAYRQSLDNLILQKGSVSADQEKTLKYAILGATSIGVVAAIYKAYMTYSIAQAQVETHKIDAYMQRKLISCAALVEAFDSLMALTQKDPALHNIVTTWQQHCSPKSADFQTLITMLRTATFKGNASFFSNLGRVRAAYTLMIKTRDEFGDMARFIGLCDAYLSIAKLYAQHQHLPKKYSFVNFAHNSTPSLKINNFWNPMLDPYKAVGNNIQLGSSPQALLVTGSNSGGKSTIMITGLTTTILLAQTLTIAPTEYIELTPFDYIATSLKIQDNLVSGNSHFVAESRHAADLLRIVQNLGNKKAFIAIDELFEGTTPTAGENALYNFCLELLKHQNLCFVVVTQYQGKPTSLESEANGACKNMKIDVIKQPNGTLVRPYTLEPGVSQVAVGAELLQEALNNA